jgi:[glutamine synthetase] adenylyltransferase / [glutamine synthetase]-adenylyl-L-tyrosine phosphorylase
MFHPDDCLRLLSDELPFQEPLAGRFASIGFDDPAGAARRLQSLCENDAQRLLFRRTVPALLYALDEAAAPDGSLLNFQRFVQTVEDRERLFQNLSEQPRAVEILVKLFVGSQFLTEILLRNPHYLERLTAHKRLAEFKSREEFIQQGLEELKGNASGEKPAAGGSSGSRLREAMNHLRRFQQWELLRIAACDTFGLLDLKTVTLQLSLLADALVHLALEEVARAEGMPVEDFTILAFGKLGGEELNYSSDIDLVFVCEEGAERYWGIGQKLIRVLSDPTDMGFLYRVDMRLRPWGKSGALVTSADAYVDYMRKHGRLWEKQALLKARPIAGNREVGQRVLDRLWPIIFEVDPDDVRRDIQEMKAKIERHLVRKGHRWGEVKGGPGGIRDIEFLTQYLQLVHGRATPEVRSMNTLDGLVRLADFELIAPEEYRRLSTAYILLRTIEHALQILHNKQEHLLPETPRGLAYLARRLDFLDADTFVQQYERHTRAVREIFERHIHQSAEPGPERRPSAVDLHFGAAAEGYYELFSEEDAERHVRLLDELDSERVVRVEADRLDDDRFHLTIVGQDRIGDLSAICGLLFAYGFDIESGHVFTGADVATTQKTIETDQTDSRERRSAGKSSKRPSSRRGVPAHSMKSIRQSLKARQRKYVDVFTVKWASQPARNHQGEEVWDRFEKELNDLMVLSGQGGVREAQGRLAHRVASAFEEIPEDLPQLLPVEIETDNDTSQDCTILNIRGDDTPGFLYELTNAIAVSSLSIIRMTIQSAGNQVLDTLYVVDEHDRKQDREEQLQQLRAAIVMIKHFTHLLPRSPNPEASLMHFQEFLENLFQRPDWLDDLRTLQDSEVLHALGRLLGVSDFLWEDFLRLQHENLFPVITDVKGLQQARDRETLAAELHRELEAAPPEKRREVLNAFKDREMMRVDMRHIMGLQYKFGMFSRELTAVAEAVVEAAWRICDEELRVQHGRPLQPDDSPSRLAVCALGKCGGEELGYASDIELMFIYEADGHTSGLPKSQVNENPPPNEPDGNEALPPSPRPPVPSSPPPLFPPASSPPASSITNVEYYQRLVEAFNKTIHSKRQGIFEVDLRLRPYGNAGSLAVSLETFEKYFGPQGPAWPYERQALVKLRPIAGDPEFGEQVVETRDRLIYRGEQFDVAAMRAMREKQITQLVQAGTFNAKLSPGGLVDCEYVVQALQITFGHLDKSIRQPNTREAMKALEAHGILAETARVRLRDAYRFFRRVIDALRMVRGDASDLTVPPPGSDEFVFLARRLEYDSRRVGRFLTRDGEPPAHPADLDDEELEAISAGSLVSKASAEKLREDLERHRDNVIEIVESLDQMLQTGLKAET